MAIQKKTIPSFLLCAVCLPAMVFADSFIIPNQTIVSTTQNMDGNDEVGVVELGARINITTNNDMGILSTGTGASIINRGTISNTGSNSDGIYSGGISASISNSGVISVYGTGARGIRSIETSASIINSGNISTAGFGGFGIETIGANAVIMNKGSIETVDGSTYGIVSRGSYVVMTNDGLVSTTGFEARAIESTAQNANITNNGSIRTTGQSSHGIDMGSPDGRIINRGSIFTSGDGSIGVNSSMLGSTLSNFGEIATYGASLADAVVMSGANSVVTNFGRITASGGSSYAIFGGNGKQTLNIMSGSRITGRINLEGTGDDDQVNFYGSDGSASITVENSEFIGIYNPNATRVGDKIVYVDPSIDAFSRRNLNSLTIAAHSSVAQRLTGVVASKSAVSLNTNQFIHSQGGSTLWVDTFIQKDQRDHEEFIQGYKSHLYGFVIGHEVVDRVSQLGVFGGVAKSDTKSSSNTRQSDSVFFGVNGRHDVQSVQFSGSMLLGYSEHQLQRQVLDNLDGLMTASSRTSGVFFSPSVSISSTNTRLGSFGIQPSATVTYSQELIKGYSETGANLSNVRFNNQKVQALSTRIQLEKIKTMSGGEFIVRAGVHSRKTLSRNEVTSISGTGFTINPQSGDSAVGLFVGVQVDTLLIGPLRLKLRFGYGNMGRNERISNASMILFAQL